MATTNRTSQEQKMITVTNGTEVKQVPESHFRWGSAEHKALIIGEWRVIA